MNRETLIKNKYRKVNKNINYGKNIDTDFDIKVNGVNKKDNYTITIKIDADIEDFFKNVEIINFIETMKEGHITSITKNEFINDLIREKYYELLDINEECSKDDILLKWLEYKKSNGIDVMLKKLSK